MSCNLSPQEFFLFGQSKICSYNVQALDDLVACHLDFVHKEVSAILVHGQVVKGGDEDGHQDLEDVLQ